MEKEKTKRTQTESKHTRPSQNKFENPKELKWVRAIKPRNRDKHKNTQTYTAMRYGEDTAKEKQHLAK